MNLFGFITLLQATPSSSPTEINVHPTVTLIHKLENWIHNTIKLLPNILVAIIFFAIVFYLAKWVGKLVRRVFKRKGRENFGEVLGSFARWGITVIGFAFAVTIVSPNLTPGDLIAGLGVSSVAIGFAFKDILQNWLAGILILSRQPFKIGDEIIVNSYEGIVERVETRATTIKTYDGQDVIIPNSDIYTNAVKVKTANEYVRSQYDLGLGYDQPYEKAMKILEETIRKVEGVIADKPVDILVWDQADWWLTIRMRWWTKPKRAEVVKVYSQVLLATQNAMNDANIDLPFPTEVRIHDAHDIAEARNDHEKSDSIYDSKRYQENHYKFAKNKSNSNR